MLPHSHSAPWNNATTWGSNTAILPLGVQDLRRFFWHDPDELVFGKQMIMESKEELYHHGHNPYYYETFNDEMCARVLFALETLRIPYTRVPYLEQDVRSLRFYVQDRPSLIKLQKFLNDAHPSFDHGDAYEKYELVYENSFI